MKLSLTLSALILACCGWIGWRNQAALAGAIATRDQLAAEARGLGIGSGDLQGGAALRRAARDPRESLSGHGEEMRALGDRLTGFRARMEKLREAEPMRQFNAEDRAESLALLNEMLQLDSAQLKTLIADLFGRDGIDDGTREASLEAALSCLAESDPVAALKLAIGSQEIAEKGYADSLVTAALGKLAEKNPQEAMDWIRTQGKDHAEFLSDGSRMGVLIGAAKNDPGLAFSLLPELGLAQTGAAFQIAAAALTPAEQLNVLEAMRGYLKHAPDEKAEDVARSATVSQLAKMTIGNGYEKASAWLKTADLSRQEAQIYLQGINPRKTGEDSGRWIEWMASRLPPEDYERTAKQIVSEWTHRDYRAAGAWLNDQPEGPVRTVAVKAYATNVAAEAPETAERWAMTLPDGEARNKLLNDIRLVWQGKDEEAAKAFSRRHGLGK